ncbi:hypothetical protein J7438_13450 [Thalassotalea sp. G20_0]|uniref:hypothetical protein n=1 Tax=Thalassotalea sp. G20_0 TaxID=2821093 RepID=UPI001ADC5A21|nr:hypothetical protein [Thalassotalea sp. G20_0]MBO9495085.1 hypothetical protein [Thalassotalea sp. G20_0]
MDNQVLDVAVIEIEGLRKRLEFAAGYYLRAHRITGTREDLVRAIELDELMENLRRLTIECTEDSEHLSRLTERA